MWRTAEFKKGVDQDARLLHNPYRVFFKIVTKKLMASNQKNTSRDAASFFCIQHDKKEQLIICMENRM